MSLLLMVVLAVAPVEVVEETPTWGANVGASALSYNLAGLGGEVGAERKLTEHVSVELRLGGSYTRSSFTIASLAAVPGVRYYFTSVFRGAWLGAQLLFGGQGISGTGGLGGLGGVIGGVPSGSTDVSWFAQFGATASLGWNFRWDNGFTLGLSAGPSGTYTPGTAFASSALNLGLRAAVAFGLSF